MRALCRFRDTAIFDIASARDRLGKRKRRRADDADLPAWTISTSQLGAVDRVRFPSLSLFVPRRIERRAQTHL